jgi:hypothetical protein
MTFDSSVVEEGTQIVEVDFAQLEDDLQILIREWAEQQLGHKYCEVNGGSDFARIGGADTPISMNQIKQDYISCRLYWKGGS